MPRRRMIDPKFWGDETIGKLEPQERLFYIGLFSLADDEGRICGSPSFLRSQIYPYDDMSPDSIVTWISHLKDVGLIHVYEDPSGNRNTYIDHPKWFKYQTINRPQPSLLPTCPKFRSHHRKPKNPHGGITDGSVNDSVNDSRPEEVKGSKEKLKEVKSSTVGGSDSRVARLLKFFGIVFKDTFGVTYKANFKTDGKIIKDQLRYADKSYPKGRAEIALANTIDTWLEKQKELGVFKKTTIPGWLKDFNSTNADIDWDTTNWEEMEKEYEDVQKKIKSQK